MASSSSDLTNDDESLTAIRKEPKVEEGGFSFEVSSLITVEVGVGPLQKHFAVHEDLICKRSEFFRCALSGNWAASSERIIRLSDVETSVFRSYLNVAYRNQLPGQLADDLSRERIYEEYQAMVETYVLAERLQDVEAKNTIVLSILALSKRSFGGQWCCPRLKAVAVLYEGTVQGDKCRQLLVDLWTWFSGRALILQLSKQDDVPYDFLRDLLFKIAMEEFRLGRETDGKQYLVDIAAGTSDVGSSKITL